MSYMHIDNLYKNKTILSFRECYAMEKIHGTSAHLGWSHDQKKLFLFAGGCKQDHFNSIFNPEELIKKFEAVGTSFTIFGEAYGGRMQAMSHTYGDKLSFIAFEVKREDSWLNVEEACSFCQSLGIEFVPFERGPCDIEWLDKQRDLPSRVAKRRGIVEDKIAEGIVIRPPFEVTLSGRERVIAKHKRPEFSEHRTPKSINPKKESGDLNIAKNWVTEMRLTHVFDSLGLQRYDITKTGDVIRAMIEDIKRESSGEFEWNDNIQRFVGQITATLYKARCYAI